MNVSEIVGMALAEPGAVNPAMELPLARAQVLFDADHSDLARTRPTVLLIFHLVVVLGFALSGYPTGRVAALGVLFAFSVGIQAWASRCHTQKTLTSDKVLAWMFWHTGIQAVAYGLTGGLQSPLVVSSLAPLVVALVIFGRRRETRLVAGAVVGSALVLALLPAWVRGPAVPPPWGIGLTLLALFFSVGMIRGSMNTLLLAFQQKGEALHRAHEDMVAQALERARSLEQVGSNVAHELKNPLAAIKGLVQLVARAQSADEKMKERLAVVEKEVGRMEVILREYLSFSRPLEDLKPQPLDLSTLAGEVLAVLEARAQSGGVKLAVRGGASVQGDPRRLREALLNLAANALEATPSGGEVSIEIAPSECGAQLRVCDTGRGMPPEIAARVGTPFFTTRESGTGLGVTLARAVFVQHGGGLSYESAPGKGTVATATLARQPPPARLALCPAVLHEPAPCGGAPLPKPA